MWCNHDNVCIAVNNVIQAWSTLSIHGQCILYLYLLWCTNRMNTIRNQQKDTWMDGCGIKGCCITLVINQYTIHALFVSCMMRSGINTIACNKNNNTFTCLQQDILFSAVLCTVYFFLVIVTVSLASCCLESWYYLFRLLILWL